MAPAKPDAAGELEAAIQRGTQRYFRACRERVDSFSRRHFRYPGAWQTNRVAIGPDLLRAPLNLLWAPVYLLSQLLAWTLQRLGLKSLGRLLQRTPAGLNTDVQRRLAGLCRRELLLLPAQQSDRTDPLVSAVIGEIDRSLHAAADPRELQGTLQPILEDTLQQYALSRSATADIGNSLSATLLGAFAFQKFTPGGVAIGVLLAGLGARELAVSNFPLGSDLGRLWYGWFPPEPSLALSAAMTLGVLIMLAALASLSGLLSDPLQCLLGLHQRRLYRMIDHLEAAVSRRSQGRFHSREHYLARVLDLIDAARSQWP
jgi:hypothetical protein